MRLSRRSILAVLASLSLPAWILGNISSPSARVALQSATYLGTQTEVRADFDGDGISDRAVVAKPGSREAIHLSFSRRSEILLENGDAPIATLLATDFDHDGHRDIVATTASADLIIWINNGHGGFSILPPRSTDRHQIGGERGWYTDPSDGGHAAVAERAKGPSGRLPTARGFHPLSVLPNLCQYQSSSPGLARGARHVPRGPPLA